MKKPPVNRAADAGGRDRTTNQMAVRLIVSTVLLMLSLSPAGAFRQLDEVRVLSRDLWPKTRTGDIIRGLQPLRRTVEVYTGYNDARILVHFKAGSVGNAWAFEVKEWLVAFGVESEHIVLRPGPVDEFSLGLSVIK